MAEIIDCGNGYGLLRGYGSKHANLTFPLSVSSIRRLHVEGYLSDEETRRAFDDIGYTSREREWLIAIDNLPIA